MKRSTLIRAGIIAVIAVILLVAGIIILNRVDQEQYAETRG